MMDFKEFTEDVLKKIREKAEGKFDAWTTDIVKNNGIRMTGITTVAKGSSIGPCVYLDGYYKKYADGSLEMERIMEEIWGEIVRNQESMPEIDMAGFQNWETVKGHIYARLVNARMNKELLEDMPHRMLLDLAVVYAVKVDMSKEGVGSILIHSQHMEMWHQNEESLYRTAMENMCFNSEAVYDSFEEIMKDFLKENSSYHGTGVFGDGGMYVLTNKSRLFGASSILRTDILAEIAERAKSNLIILPSSVHELLLLPESGDEIPDRDSFCRMICDVNNECLSDMEILSNHPYFYNRSTAQITAA